MGVNGAKKGKSNEREVADLISNWWFGVPRAIRRTPGSGGWSKTQAAGDLISEVQPFPFSVECKDNKSWDFKNDLFKTDLGDVGDYWRQCLSDSEKQMDKVPLLIFKGMRTKYFAMFDPLKLFISEASPGIFVQNLRIVHLSAILEIEPMTFLGLNGGQLGGVTIEALTKQREWATKQPQFQKGYKYNAPDTQA